MTNRTHELMGDGLALPAKAFQKAASSVDESIGFWVQRKSGYMSIYNLEAALRDWSRYGRPIYVGLRRQFADGNYSSQPADEVFCVKAASQERIEAAAEWNRQSKLRRQAVKGAASSSS